MPKQKHQHEDGLEPDAALNGADSIELSEAAAELVGRLEAERDEAVEARQRALADFRNYQRRAAESELRAGLGGAASVVRSLLSVIDHLDLALGQDTEQISVEQILGGVRMMRDELLKTLDTHSVERIDPARGDEFDPNLHQAMMHQPASCAPRQGFARR